MGGHSFYCQYKTVAAVAIFKAGATISKPRDKYRPTSVLNAP